MQDAITRALVALLEATIRLLPALALGELLSRLKAHRMRGEGRGPHKYAAHIKDGPDAPKWWFTFRGLFRDENWKLLYELGREFLQRPCPDLPRARFTLWVAIAAFRTAEYREAVQLAEQAREGCTDSPLRALILGNLVGFYVRIGAYDAAGAAFAEAMLLDPELTLTHYNGLVHASAQHDEHVCRERAELLIENHAEATDPSSEVGAGVKKDPDLAFFRTTGAYADLFGEETNVETSAEGSGVASPKPETQLARNIAFLLIGTTLYLLWFASAALAIMTSG